MEHSSQGPFAHLVEMASEHLGGRTLFATDDFFAEKENLLKPGRGVFIVDKYTERGKWMDGWESRRKRTAGHDYCIVKLGLPGEVRGVDVDTNHFTGNFPEHASIEACEAAADATPEQLERAAWTEVLAISRLQGGSQNFFPVHKPGRFTHLKLHIYPDGGVARLRVYGVVAPDWSKLSGTVDLAAVENGGVVLLANDNFFGPKDNLIAPGAPLNMGGGWETRRKRGPGNDWVVLRLGKPGVLERAEVYTTHFKGNYPDRCSLEGARLPHEAPADFLASRSIAWETVLPESKLQADHKHVYELPNAGPYSHVRLSIYPDGGVARLRLFGRP